jgi:two-component system, OmpR family, sensor histidine kinase KdpD
VSSQRSKVAGETAPIPAYSEVTVTDRRSIETSHVTQTRTLLVATGGPALVTLLAVPDVHIPTTTASLFYVLVVTIAAATAGPRAGVAASLLSFLALNFFFTPPLHTFAVDKSQDLVALIVFLLVSVITGFLLSRAVREKTRAVTREQQTLLTNQFTSRLLSGRPLQEVLQE